jgi:hypothetical protein
VEQSVDVVGKLVERPVVTVVIRFSAKVKRLARMTGRPKSLVVRREGLEADRREGGLSGSDGVGHDPLQEDGVSAEHDVGGAQEVRNSGVRVQELDDPREVLVVEPIGAIRTIRSRSMSEMMIRGCETVVTSAGALSPSVSQPPESNC